MKCFRVERIDPLEYYEDYSMVVIAEDSMSAEKLSRLESDDFRKAKLKVTEIDMNKEQVILIADTGA